MSTPDMTTVLTLQAGMIVAGMTPGQIRERVGLDGARAEQVETIVTGAVPPTTHRELASYCWVAATLGGWHCQTESLVRCSDGRAGHVDLVARKGEREVLVEIKTKPESVREAASQLRRYASAWSVPSPEQMIVCPRPPISVWGEQTVNPIDVVGPSEFARLFAYPVLRALPTITAEVPA